MSRFFSSVSALGRSAIQWINKDKLPSDYVTAAEIYTSNGAVKASPLPFENTRHNADIFQKVGEIKKVEIL